jgi:uncharacterized protein (TIGR02145 family)
MQDKSSYSSNQPKISQGLHDFINAMVEEIVLKGEAFDEQKKKWLKKYSEAEGLNFGELEGNLNDFFEAFHDYKRTQVNSILKLLKIQAISCFIENQVLDKLLTHKCILLPVENNIIVPDAQFKTLKIGNQIWMAENMNVDRFRNGDPIPEAKSFAEWKKALQNKQPAFCFFNFEQSISVKMDKMYNQYALTDARLITPNGFYLPTTEDVVLLFDIIKNKSKFNELNGLTLKQHGFSSNPNCVLTTIGRFDKDNCLWWTEQAKFVFGWNMGLLILEDFKEHHINVVPTGLFIRVIKKV